MWKVGIHVEIDYIYGDWKYIQGVGIYMRNRNTDKVGIYLEIGYKNYMEEKLTQNEDTYKVKIYIKR